MVVIAVKESAVNTQLHSLKSANALGKVFQSWTSENFIFSGFTGRNCDAISRSSLSIVISLFAISIIIVIGLSVCLIRAKRRERGRNEKATETIALNES